VTAGDPYVWPVAGRVRRQHVISQFYLRGFANESSRIKRIELPGVEPVVLTTSNASVIKDFYTVELLDGTPSDMFEKFFGTFEGPAATALSGVRHGTWPLRPVDREALAGWVALQHLRGEEIRHGQSALDAFHIRILVGTSGKEALRRLIETREGVRLHEEQLDWEWADLTKPGGPHLEPDPGDHMDFLLGTLPGLTAHLMSWHWTLLEFEDAALGTSDHPVSLVPGEDHPPGMGLGIATAALFYIPLTQSLGLTIQPRDRFPAALGFVPDLKHVADPEHAKSFNQQTAWSARHYVYCHPEADPFAAPVVLPAPRRHGWSDAGADRMIREEGLFGGLSEEQLAAMPKVLPGDDGPRSEGMSLDDLTWPIPRRLGSRPDAVLIATEDEDLPGDRGR
jgi:hypothetical protein